MAVPAVSPTIRVLTFNILAGHDLERRLDLGRTADVIAACEPDVVGLQEVDRHFSDRSEYADQTAVLAERLGGWSHAFAPGLDLDPEEGRTERRQFGPALLTPHRLVTAGAQRLENLPSDDPQLEPRAVVTAIVEVGGQRLEVLNTHLDHRSPQQRIHQARQVSALVGATAGPAVVMGDLNAASDTAEVRVLASGLMDATLSIPGALTYPSDVPEVRLDHIFVRELMPLRAAVLDVRASDHRPVLAELGWA